MADPKYSSGDQVILRSGGPFMTVDKTINGHVTCYWFGRDQALFKEIFAEPLLKSREEHRVQTAGRRSVQTD